MRCVAVGLALLVSACGVWGQVPSASPATAAAVGAEFKRWLDIDGWTLSTRYRYIRNRAGVVTNNQQQWQMQFRPRFKFDKAGRFSIAAFIGTGNNFTAGWNNMGIGTGHGQTNLYVKHLFFDARPTRKIELQFGGFAVNYGENTEVTSYDNDNYITGERIVIRHPKALFFDEISLTNAYLGDLNHPSIFGRLHRLGQANYHQFLFRKQATKQVGFSADYTFASGTDTIREAIRVKPRNFFLTTILVEAYERVSTPSGSGFDLFGEKVWNKRWTASGGFARIDRRLTLNGDKFPPGQRIYGSLTYKPSPEFSIAPMIIQGVGPLPTAGTPRTRFDLVFAWNVLESLHRHRIF